MLAWGISWLCIVILGTHPSILACKVAVLAFNLLLGFQFLFICQIAFNAVVECVVKLLLIDALRRVMISKKILVERR